MRSGVRTPLPPPSKSKGPGKPGPFLCLCLFWGKPGAADKRCVRKVIRSGFQSHVPGFGGPNRRLGHGGCPSSCPEWPETAVGVQKKAETWSHLAVGRAHLPVFRAPTAFSGQDTPDLPSLFVPQPPIRTKTSPMRVFLGFRRVEGGADSSLQVSLDNPQAWLADEGGLVDAFVEMSAIVRGKEGEIP